MGDPTGALTQLSPEKALTLAEKLYTLSPSEKTKLKIIQVAINTEHWMLADILMDELRPCKSFEPQVFNAMIVAHNAPEELPTALLDIHAAPQNDEERILLLQLASFAGDDNLRSLARRSSRNIDNANLRNRAGIFLARMAMNEGHLQEAREIIARLIDKRISAADCVSVLQICETLQTSEAADYKSTLKLAARSSAPLAITLAHYFSKTEAPDKILAWLNSLPEEITATPEIKMELVGLAAKTGKTIDWKSSAPQTPKELMLSAHLARETENYKEELETLDKLNRLAPQLWSLLAACQASEHIRDADALHECLAALSRRLPGNLLVASQLAYLDLTQAKPNAKEDYDSLKTAQTRYPERAEIKTYLALADYRLGNLTDALILLPKDPSTIRAKLICAAVLANAGQNDHAEAILKEISPEALLPNEGILYQATFKKLQESAPLREWINILKRN